MEYLMSIELPRRFLYYVSPLSYLLVVAAFLITCWHKYKNQKLYQISNGLCLLASILVALIRYVYEFYRTFYLRGMEIDLQFIFLHSRPQLVLLAFIVIWFVFALLAEYSIIRISEHNRYILFWVLGLSMVVIYAYFFIFANPTREYITPLTEEGLRMYSLIKMQDTLRLYDMVPFGYLCALEGWRHDSVKKQEKTNRL